jgi:7-cyano-7-deazaguanine synthase
MFADAPAGKVVISLSGGMDSTGLLMHLLAKGSQVYGISFDYGQKHILELERLKANIEYLKNNDIHVQHDVVDLSILGKLYSSALTDPDWEVPEGHYEQENMKQTVVPNRNAIFASIAYGYALSIATKNDEQVSIALGVHSGDHAIYPDCRPEFYEAIHKAFALGNWDSEKVDLYLPYLEGDKYTILKDAEEAIAKIGLDFDTVFKNTNTSYEPDELGRASGKTGADVERIEAFVQLGRKDPIEYQTTWELLIKDEH